MPSGYWFQTDLFQIEPGEDDEINPGIYGRQFAAWLKSQLEQRGQAIEAIVAEDWGRCLVCSGSPFFLWVGCANLSDDVERSPDDSPQKNREIVWHCFATAEVPFWKRLFRRIGAAPAVAKLNAALREILKSEPRIEVVDEP
jgi:hypothetical protein